MIPAGTTGFSIDSRKVAPGHVFGAFPGTAMNGEDYIPAAIAAGAIAIVARPQAKVTGALHIAEENPRRAFAQMAAQFYTPAPATLVAVTGTNGKTSTVEMLRQIWQGAGHSAASIGTLGITTAQGSIHTGLTTPDIVTFLSALQNLAAQGVTHLAYEASSHGLDQYRNEGPTVLAGAFTNLSRDHLDYHHTMDAYFAAKMRLFSEIITPQGTAVLWADDPWSRQAEAQAQTRGLSIISVGKNGKTIRLLDRQPTPLGQILTLSHAGQEHRLDLPLIGAYQAANALVAAGLAMATAMPPAQVFDHITRLRPVRGRLEHAALNAAGAPAYVDYAHTPDGLAAAIDALRPHTTGRLILVFGAGGDRDPGKRPAMGRIAADQADIAIVTDDNPRGEDPAAIRAAILSGMTAPRARVQEIASRRDAIVEAMQIAGEGDIVLIAGKGHEQGQILGRGADTRILPFDDATVAREATGEIA
jgi:UDP-N-acetylmuramoyl-L-alanyl-D-glutamate--2,6-diaminopimelate ligase